MNIGQTTTFVDTNDLLSHLTERMDYLSNNPSGISGLDTGFTELNKLTHGLQKSDNRSRYTRTGKTSFAMNLATYAIQQTVAIFSLEMPDVQLGNRIISSISGVNFQR